MAAVGWQSSRRVKGPRLCAIGALGLAVGSGLQATSRAELGAWCVAGALQQGSPPPASTQGSRISGEQSTDSVKSHW